MERTITLTLEVEREEDQYVSLCPELDVASYGETVEDALARLKDAVSLSLDTIEHDGERERVFQERGIRIDERLGTDYRATLHPGVLATVKWSHRSYHAGWSSRSWRVKASFSEMREAPTASTSVPPSAAV